MAEIPTTTIRCHHCGTLDDHDQTKCYKCGNPLHQHQGGNQMTTCDCPPGWESRCDATPCDRKQTTSIAARIRSRAFWFAPQTGVWPPLGVWVALAFTTAMVMIGICL